MDNKTDLQKFSEIATESQVTFLLKELLKGFTVTDQGLMWYYHDKTLHQVAGAEFELMLAPFLPQAQQKALQYLYGLTDKPA